MTRIRPIAPTNNIQHSEIYTTNTVKEYLSDNFYTKSEIDTQLTCALTFKGTVADMSELNAIVNPKVGDMYNVLDDGSGIPGCNYAWVADTNEWDKLGGSFDLTPYATKVWTMTEINNATTIDSTMVSEFFGQVSITNNVDYQFPKHVFVFATDYATGWNSPMDVVNKGYLDTRLTPVNNEIASINALYAPGGAIYNTFEAIDNSIQASTDPYTVTAPLNKTGTTLGIDIQILATDLYNNANFARKDMDQTISGAWTFVTDIGSSNTARFEVPVEFARGVDFGDSTVISRPPTGNDDITNKGYVDGAISTAISTKANTADVVNLTTNQTIAGTKTFSISPLIPTATTGDNSTKAASTAFVNAAVATGTTGIAHLDGVETFIGAKTFTATPFIPNTPISATHAVNKTYVDTIDTNAVHKNGSVAETITGVKTFSAAPIISSAPTADNNATTKKYVDDAIIAVTTPVASNTVAGKVKLSSAAQITNGQSIGLNASNAIVAKPNLPDYANAVRIPYTAGVTTWTATADGWISGILGIADNPAYAYIGNVIIGQSRTAENVTQGINAPISNGDILSFANLAESTLWFIPFKN